MMYFMTFPGAGSQFRRMELWVTSVIFRLPEGGRGTEKDRQCDIKTRSRSKMEIEQQEKTQSDFDINANEHTSDSLVNEGSAGSIPI